MTAAAGSRPGRAALPEAVRVAVLKFGGTCMQSAESRGLVGDRVAATRAAGWGVVVVVSAMGRRGAPYATDTLLEMVRRECPGAADRELATAYVCGELLSAALISAQFRTRGIPSTCLSGWQAGIVTSAEATDADVIAVHPQAVLDLLEHGEVPVVAGSQGATAAGDVTTLGRGGSDTTASVLGLALDAQLIEVYTDTPGIMTADPRLVPAAQTIGRLSYPACARLAELGAKVIHPKAVRVAASRPDIPLYVRGMGGEDGQNGISRVGGCGWKDTVASGLPVGLAAMTGRIRSSAAGSLLEWLPDGAPQDFAAGDCVLPGSCAQESRAARVSIVHDGPAQADAHLRFRGALLSSTGIRPLFWHQSGEVFSAWVPQDQVGAAAEALHQVAFAWPFG